MKKVLVVFHPLNQAMEYIENGGTQFAPHHFWCFDQLKKTGCQVDYLRTDAGPTFWNKLGDKFRINVLQQQLDCLKAARDYDLIFIPFMEFSFFLSLMKLLKVFNKPVVSISNFSYIPRNDNFLKKLRDQAVRYVYFRGTDLVLYYNQALFEKSRQSSISGNSLFLDNWGIDDAFFSNYLAEQDQPPTADYIYTTGGSARDFRTLIKAFNDIDFKLKITTVGNFDAYKDCLITPNIEIDNSLPFGLGSTGIIRKEYYHALGVAIPLLPTGTSQPYGITVLMEGMAMGKAVITTDNKAFPVNVAREKAGLVVDYGDVAGWKQAVQYLIDHPGEAREMGERALYLVAHKYNYRLFCERVNYQVMAMLKGKDAPAESHLRFTQKKFSSVEP